MKTWMRRTALNKIILEIGFNQKIAIDHLAVKIRKDISRYCDNFRDLNQQATIEAKIDCPFLIKALLLSYSWW